MSTRVLEGLLYTDEHDWVLIEDDIATIGITDFAQSNLGDIVYVEVPEVGDTFNTGDAFGAIESVKAAVDLLLPVSGEVVEINEELEEAPELLNEEPYDNWIVKIKLDEEPEDLMDIEAYKELLAEEE
ncbi:MAG: glycine cleavage system protein GcvH [Tissierellia bacterium]|jgi:glycine cleavage system H protein|nr:glycine cleavage system protein GcvH [Tissierellia bacterium]